MTIKSVLFDFCQEPSPTLRATLAISANNAIMRGLALIASSMITEEKMGLNGFGSYKTAGEDEIFPGLLQQGIEVVPLCTILTASLAFGYNSKAW
jgi:hypothetical protein